MAIVIAGQVLANIVGQVPAPADVESDTTAATIGTLNVNVTRIGSNGGFLEVALPASVLAQLVDGPCTITISQGAGTLSGTTTQ